MHIHYQTHTTQLTSKHHHTRMLKEPTCISPSFILPLWKCCVCCVYFMDIMVVDVGFLKCCEPLLLSNKQPKPPKKKKLWIRWWWLWKWNEMDSPWLVWLSVCMVNREGILFGTSWNSSCEKGRYGMAKPPKNEVYVVEWRVFCVI